MANKVDCYHWIEHFTSNKGKLHCADESHSAINMINSIKQLFP